MMRQVQVNIVITPDGQVAVDVVGGKGKSCITEILGPIEELLGEATDTKLKPEYEIDHVVVQIMRDQGLQL